MIISRSCDHVAWQELVRIGWRCEKLVPGKQHGELYMIMKQGAPGPVTPC